MWGPFTHGINKGGFSEIIAEQKLLSTEARGVAGGGDAVRGSYNRLDKNLPGPQRTETIEFFTHAPPDAPNPGQGWAGWRMPAGEKLDILVTRARLKDGTVVKY
jgi:hypothetical protein